MKAEAGGINGTMELWIFLALHVYYNQQTDSESCTYIVYLPSRKMGETKIHKFFALDVVFFMDKLFLMTSYTGGGGGAPTKWKRV